MQRSLVWFAQNTDCQITTCSECSSETRYENWQVFSCYTSTSEDLHWLPVRARINFKILILVFKAIHGLARPYISDLITVKLKSSYNLRSNSSLLLDPPKEKMLSTLGAGSYLVSSYLFGDIIR